MPERKHTVPAHSKLHWMHRTLGGRLTLAFAALVIVSVLAIAGMWRWYRTATYERGAADLLVGQLRAIVLVANQYGDDLTGLQAALDRSGLRVQIDPPQSNPSSRLRPRLIGQIEANASKALGQPVSITVHYVRPREAQASTAWRGHQLVVTWLLKEWQDGMPAPMLLAVALLLIFTPATAGLAIIWLQAPLKRVADAIEAQGASPAAIDIPGFATTEVVSLIHAHNRMVSEIAQRDRMRELILGGVSHDLKAPLARLRMRAALVDDVEAAEGIIRDVQSLDSIAEQFLGYVRASDAPRQAPCDAATVLDAIMHHYRERGLTWEPGPMMRDVNTLVKCDATSLERILVNLLDNAYEYGAEPVRLHASRSAATLTISVRDAGAGIPAEDLSRGLEPFVRLDPARGATGHCGLGLAIVTRLAVQAGGQLFAHTMRPGGFEIGVHLPCNDR